MLRETYEEALRILIGKDGRGITPMEAKLLQTAFAALVEREVITPDDAIRALKRFS